MENFQTFKQNISSWSFETVLSLLGFAFAVYFLGSWSNIVLSGLLGIILTILIFNRNEKVIRFLTNGIVFLMGAYFLLTLYGAAIGFDKTNGMLSESYSYPVLFIVFFISFYTFFAGLNEIKKEFKNKTESKIENKTENKNKKEVFKEKQMTIGFVILAFFLIIISAAAIHFFENPLFLPKFTTFFALGILFPVCVFYIMYVLLFWKIIPGIQSIIWLPYSLYVVDILTMFVRLIHPVGDYFPNIDLTFIHANANEFHEVIVAGILVSFLYMIAVFVLFKIFALLKRVIRKNQAKWDNFKKELSEQTTKVKISFYTLLTLIFICLTNPVVSLFNGGTYVLNSGRVHFFIVHSFQPRLSIMKNEIMMMYIPFLFILLIFILLACVLFCLSKRKSGKISKFEYLPIILYTILICVFFYALLVILTFMFVPIL
ncbi:hypothetical protein MmiAt1_11440 [Methanimicrococcus sp. At1]|uniref:Uncharacterized protein n=1 Tax=Methanimicrococcus hacksteinii TaxID=3028293 RepID=A0ABU3VQ67_9EURY|nr:hypothetical protein [Methanimicrococcus sp. At1]